VDQEVPLNAGPSKGAAVREHEDRKVCLVPMGVRENLVDTVTDDKSLCTIAGFCGKPSATLAESAASSGSEERLGLESGPTSPAYGIS
jgi:hypothetical protein